MSAKTLQTALEGARDILAGAPPNVRQAAGTLLKWLQADTSKSEQELAKASEDRLSEIRRRSIRQSAYADSLTQLARRAFPGVEESESVAQFLLTEQGAAAYRLYREAHA